MRLAIERIDELNTRWLKIGHVPCHHGETMFKRRRSNCEIKLLVAQLCRQSTPAARNSNRQGQNAFAVSP